MSAQPPVVRWELALADGTRASFEAEEGEEVRFSSKAFGLSLAFVPRVEDLEAGRARLEVFEVREGNGGKGRGARLATHELEPGVEVASPAAGGLVLKLLGMGRSGAPGCAAGRSVAGRPTEPQACCISCPPDGQTCGCSVSTECGSCCAGCCYGGGKPQS